MDRKLVALQLYSIRGEMERDFDGTLELVKSMGFDGVEFAGLFGRNPAEVKASCKKLDLAPVSAHEVIDRFFEDARQILADYEAIGCEYIVIPYLPPEYRPGQGQYDEFVALAKRVGKEAREAGMTLLYHNHDFEFEKLDGRYLLDIIYHDIAPEYLEAQIDTCWVNVGGEDPAVYLHSYTGRVPLVHLKDFVGQKSEKMYALIGIDGNKANTAAGGFEYRPLGQGHQDIPALLSASSDAGARWLIIEQDEPTLGISAMDGVKMSIDYLKGQWSAQASQVPRII